MTDLCINEATCELIMKYILIKLWSLISAILLFCFVVVVTSINNIKERQNEKLLFCHAHFFPFYQCYMNGQDHDTSLRFRFHSGYLGFYRYLVIRKVAMCHYLSGTRVTVKPFGPAL
jgi:hypothetical protein